MKCYLHGESIRLTGKGWEIRHYLRGIVGSAPSHMTLNDWLDRGPKKQPDRTLKNNEGTNTAVVLPFHRTKAY